MRDFPKAVWRTIAHWDLFAALAAGLAMLLFGLLSDRFAADRVLFITGASVSAMVGIGVWVGGRWVHDRLEGDYGRVVRELDQGDLGKVHLPYLAIAVVAICSALWNALATIAVSPPGSGPAAAVFAGVASWLVAWTLLGLASLILLTFRIQRQIDKLRRIKERADRFERGMNSSAAH